MKNLLFLAMLVLTSTVIHAQTFQKGIIKNADDSVHEGRIFIDNQAKQVILKSNYSEQSFRFSSISEVRIGNKTYIQHKIDGKTYLLSELVTGKATLFHAFGNDYLLVHEEKGNHFLNISEANKQLPGTLAVLFNDCNGLRDRIYNTDDITASRLLDFTDQYNSCSFTAFEPTQEEIKAAEWFNSDVLKIYFGVGPAFNDVTFFDSDTAQNEASFGANFGILASPAFLGALRGNLYAGLEASASFMSDKSFPNAPRDANFKVNAWRMELGSQYHLFKDGIIEPYIGIGIGFSSDYFEGSYDGFPIDVNGGNVYYAPRAGILFNLNSDHSIGIMVSYLSGYTNDLDFRRGDVVTRYQVNSQYLRTAINFYF